MKKYWKLKKLHRLSRYCTVGNCTSVFFCENGEKNHEKLENDHHGGPQNVNHIREWLFHLLQVNWVHQSEWKNIETWKSYVHLFVVVDQLYGCKTAKKHVFRLSGHLGPLGRASQGRCLLHTWWMSNMSRLWVPEEREGTGEPILDIWEQKSGHLRSVKCNGHTDFRCFSLFWAVFGHMLPGTYMYDMLSYGFLTYPRGHMAPGRPFWTSGSRKPVIWSQ